MMGEYNQVGPSSPTDKTFITGVGTMSGTTFSDIHAKPERSMRLFDPVKASKEAQAQMDAKEMVARREQRRKSQSTLNRAAGHVEAKLLLERGRGARDPAHHRDPAERLLPPGVSMHISPFGTELPSGDGDIGGTNGGQLRMVALDVLDAETDVDRAWPVATSIMAARRRGGGGLSMTELSKSLNEGSHTSARTSSGAWQSRMRSRARARARAALRDEISAGRHPSFAAASLAAAHEAVGDHDGARLVDEVGCPADRLIRGSEIAFPLPGTPFYEELESPRTAYGLPPDPEDQERKRQSCRAKLAAAQMPTLEFDTMRMQMKNELEEEVRMDHGRRCSFGGALFASNTWHSQFAAVAAAAAAAAAACFGETHMRTPPTNSIFRW